MRPALPTVAALLCVALPCATACGLDTSGIGPNSGSRGSATSGGSTGGGDDATTTVAATTADSGTASGETSGVATTVDPDTTGDDVSGDGTDASATTSTSTTEPADPCADNPPFTLVIEAHEAALGAPVALGELLDSTQYVYGESAQAGSASFEIAVPCSDDYMVWADVYDGEPGPTNIDALPGDPADELRVEFGGVATDWTYGCQTAGFELWTRQAVSTHELDCLSDDKVVYTLEAGMHTLSIVPLEAGDHTGYLTPGDVAAVARIIITNQLDVQP